VKNRRDRLVVLNSVARSVIEEQRGQHPVWVFSVAGKPVQRMLQKAWRLARQRAAEKWRALKDEPAPAGFAQLRVHDLKHTFGHRLEAAGVSDRECQALLGHARKGVTRKYMAPEVARLMQAAESVLNTERQGTVPLTIIRRKVA
jgi:integrase